MENRIKEVQYGPLHKGPRRQHRGMTPEDCGTVDDTISARWGDRPCNQTHRFVCERDIESL